MEITYKLWQRKKKGNRQYKNISNSIEKIKTQRLCPRYIKIPLPLDSTNKEKKSIY